MAEWFEEWFGEEYLSLYPHRDSAEATRLVTLLTQRLPWRRGWRVLDVACGAGRHAAALAAAGARVVGLDLSWSLLRRARNATAVPLVRADMRALPVRPQSMDLTVNLFTSFGYFDTDEEHQAALDGMIGTVRPGGWFAIDFLNAARVIRTLVPEEHAQLGGTEAHIERRVTADRRHVVKDIATSDGRAFQERVRLFLPEEIESMVGRTPARVVERFGTYDGAPLEDSSPRAIFLARRP